MVHARSMAPSRVAMFTVLALFSAVLLGGCESKGSAAAEPDVLSEVDRAVESSSTEISIYYPSADIIAEEKVVIDDAKGSIPLTAMRTLFEAKPENPELRVTLPTTEVNSVRIEDGVAWVDFDSDVVVTGETEQTQRTALAAIIYTLKQFDDVEKVAFTVEGKKDGTVDGKDVEKFWGIVTLSDMPWSLTATRTSE